MSGEELEEGVTTRFGDARTYGGYLALPELLACQRPVSQSHDELLFITIHQTSELWLKLMIHELCAARERIRAGDLGPCFKMLARVVRIEAQLVQSWDVLATLTPADYLAFRHLLGPASGFQSHQYRMVEFLLGNRSTARLAVFEESPDIHAALAEELARPSLYDEALRLLARRGLPVARSVLARDVHQRHPADKSVERAWHAVYADSTHHWDLYELAEKLVDLEDGFRQWRFRRVTTVERIIGQRRGTGGTSGVEYLRRAAGQILFPELWTVRTGL
ncbi:tryptophan 2,3-dioxygenase family protein [Geminicoccaceae bacterium 1502E]|nr:tryptophan 2,3-dioxygenase family protein [Geminicoccaceae bacterium 1502E]